MSRWNIETIVFYSHDGRHRTIELSVGAVNIITGNSATGKSGLAEVIDYVMGASDCHIPGLVRDASAWVGLVWVRDGTRCFMCRKVPKPTQKTEDDVVFIVGADIELPHSASELKRNASRATALRRFEQLVGLAEVETELFGSLNRRPVRISFRNAMPYLLQDDDYIISKNALLRGSADERKQSIIDTLPYFLGVVDEESVEREGILRRLRNELAAHERRASAREALRGEGLATVQALVAEAAQVGLLKAAPVEMTFDDAVALLRNVERDDAPPNPFAADDELDRLYGRERELTAEASAVRTRIEQVRRVLRASDAYAQAGQEHLDRLSVVKLLPNSPHIERCPVCAQSLSGQVEAVGTVRQAFRRVHDELSGVARDRPRIDGRLRQLEEERARVSTRLSAVRESISALVRESDDRKQGLELQQRQYRVQGRISLFLDAIRPPEGAASGEGRVDDLKSRIAALDSELNSNAKLEALENARQRLLAAATEIASQLPLEERYRGSPLDLNLRTLSVGIVTPRRREEMRDVGSDENYLTLHVSLLLGLHRLFAERARPVPGFVLFDQLSRPYYPPDPGRVVEAVVSAAQPEVASLRRYFDVLFAEVKRDEGLQILVLEHAYFSDDPRYVAATRQRWIDGRALIPADWPDAEPASPPQQDEV